MKNKVLLIAAFMTIMIRINGGCNLSFPPPPVNVTTKHYFESNELDVNSIFLDNLFKVLSRKELYSDDEHCIMNFQKIDSSTYKIWVIMFNQPDRYSIGYAKKGDYYYWFDENTPKDIILKTKGKAKFSHITHSIPSIYDPQTWVLLYNNQTGCFQELEESYYISD
ncbi:MAG: hypothetical protein ACRCZQ_06810 [Bacteroidales bacterium]